MRRCKDTDENMDCYFGMSAWPSPTRKAAAPARTRECIFVRRYNVTDFTATDRYMQHSYSLVQPMTHAMRRQTSTGKAIGPLPH